MAEMMARLDADGDGEVSLLEWGESMPDEFRRSLRGFGPGLLESAGGRTAQGSVASEDARGQEMAAYLAAMEEKKKARPRGDWIASARPAAAGRPHPPSRQLLIGSWPTAPSRRPCAQPRADACRRRRRQVSRQYDASVHMAAARRGERAVEVDLFLMYDVDHSGSLTARELRRALAMVRTKAGKRPVPGMEAMLAKLDEDGDGEVTMAEWCGMPAEFRQGLRALGPGILEASAAVQTKGSVAAEDARGRQRREAAAAEAEARAYQRRIGAGDVATRVAALKQGTLDAASIFREFDRDFSGALAVNHL
jgi:hypothetical protein